MKLFAPRLRRALSILTLFALCTGAGAEFLPVAETTLPLSQNAALTDSVLRDDNTASLRRERVVSFTPGGETIPRVVYGSTLFGETAMDDIEAYPAAWNYDVLSGVNGSFFDFGTGIPYGAVVTDGALRTSGDLEAVGFRADGTAIIGKPGIAVRLTFPDGTAIDCHLNKTLTRSNGLVLYSRDYDSRTKNTQNAFHVVLGTDEPDLLLGTTRTLTVRETGEAVSCPIPEGGFVLSMAVDTEYPGTLQNHLLPLKEGDVLTVSVEVDPAWADVVSACGGMEMLVQDGAVKQDFLLTSAKQRSARTAVGVREDGTVVFYTVDSRDSTGMTLPELAEKMLALGCRNALNLDGGGSTALRARLPGTESTQTINTPSDGKLRRCANFIFLLLPKTEAGQAAQLFAYPYGAYLLPYGSVELTITAADERCLPTAVPEETVLTAEGGEITDGNIFTALTPGQATVTLTAGEITGSLSLTVLETPDSIGVFREEDEKTGGGSVFCNETPDFTARATYAGEPVYASDKSFIWSCDSVIGAIDENGLFTPVKTYTPLQGEVRCAAGEKERRIAITVLPDHPFPDTELHWAREAVKTMYDAGVMQGAEKDGVPYFRPDDPMTRQEFLTALVRSLGTDLAQYEETELPFADTEEIADWAMPAVRAAYALGYVSGSARDGALYAMAQSPISRQEAMTILARTLPAEETEPEEDPLAVFADTQNVADWARQSLARMVGKGIISGMNGELRPREPVTRAQVAKMLAELRN
ncbi:MAG: phosphodiester glycosidase family protein [Oscillospiraceae bacterium]|nr:phosphodiester glycosidase family protein [Oscillospiraceae bacterium]